MSDSGPLTAVVLTGPTASGKSELALRLAEQFPVEIISVDSAQVYRGLDIGSAKPTAATRARVPHHLLDVRDPAEVYNAGDFVEDALALIPQIVSRGRLPLLVGGTMLYLRSLLHGMAALPRANLPVRAAIDARAAALGWPALHAELAKVDPLAGARIHPNDAQRIQRALEVFESSGRPISDWQRATVAPAGIRFLRWALLPSDRDELKRRVAARFAAMMELGLLDEVRVLAARADLRGDEPALRSVGYRQLWQHVRAGVPLEQARVAAVTATLQLVRRQYTWIRGGDAWQIIEPFDAGAVNGWISCVRAATGSGSP
jgi:tRNA dimethylallyltransferase